jgi:hypothetical protein
MNIDLLLTRLKVTLLTVSEASVRAFPGSTVDQVDAFIGSYLRHAPFKPGCPRHKVKSAQVIQLLTLLAYCLKSPMMRDYTNDNEFVANFISVRNSNAE